MITKTFMTRILLLYYKFGEKIQIQIVQKVYL